MSKKDRETQAYEYQKIYSNRDVEELIQNALESKYPLPESRPSNFGIEEMVEYLYNIKN